MPAYVISEVEILDEAAAKSYMKLAESSITDYAGRYLARGAYAEVMEGEPTTRKVVIVEFPSMDQAHEWYESPAYARALKFRDQALNRRLIFIDGVSPFSSE